MAPAMSNIIYNSWDLETAQMPIRRWVNKKAVVHFHNGTLHGSKKEETLLPFATAWMDLENIMRSEMSQSEKDEYHKILLICGI